MIKKKVLIVDDDRAVGDMLADILEVEYQTHFISDHRHIESEIKDGDYDMILTDLEMPHLNGVEVVELAQKHVPPIPVYLLTGHSPHDNEARLAISKGAKGIISKPFPPIHQMLDYLKPRSDT